MSTISRRASRVSLYFNVTYGCNSGCVFCASGSQQAVSRNDLPVRYVLDAFDRFDLGDGDEVILNGGEPTTYRALSQVVTEAANRGARVILFTNGRRLSNQAFATALLTAGVHRLSIPLHGRLAETHDALTGRKGSWQETVKGIQLAQYIQRETSYPHELELKVLAVRSALSEWPAIVDWTADQDIQPHTLVMSGLHMWSTAVGGYHPDVVPTESELRMYANMALRKALSYGYHVVTWAMPLCLFDSELLARIRTSSELTVDVLRQAELQTLYFDAHCPEGVEVPTEEVVHPDQGLIKCQICAMASKCGPGQAFFGLVEHWMTDGMTAL